MASSVRPVLPHMYILSLLFCLKVHQSLYSLWLEHLFTVMLYGFRRDALFSSMSILSLLFCLQVHQSLYSLWLEHLFTVMLYGFRPDALFFLYVYPFSSVLSAVSSPILDSKIMFKKLWNHIHLYFLRNVVN